MTAAVGRACAKAILLGEHAVVYGVPALAVGLDRGVTVTLSDGGPNDPLPEEAAQALSAMAAACEVDLAALAVRVDTEVPAGAGLGASAALSVATARALLAHTGEHEPSPGAVLELAAIGEKVFHGNPSGIDAATAADGGLLRFRRGGKRRVLSIDRLPLDSPIPLVVADTGERASTRKMVDSVARLHKANKAGTRSLFDLLGALVEAAVPALGAADWEALGHAMDAAHSLLQQLQVSTARLDDGVGLARRAGALGAKLTGSGGGGCLVAVAPEPEPVVALLSSKGFDAFAVRAG